MKKLKIRWKLKLKQVYEKSFKIIKTIFKIYLKKGISAKIVKKSQKSSKNVKISQKVQKKWSKIEKKCEKLGECSIKIW